MDVQDLVEELVWRSLEKIETNGWTAGAGGSESRSGGLSGRFNSSAAC